MKLVRESRAFLRRSAKRALKRLRLRKRLLPMRRLVRKRRKDLVKARRRLRDSSRRATYPYTTMFVTHRHELPELLNTRGLVGSGAEVGVQEGYFSALLLSRWHGERLLSIDPWAEASDTSYVDVANHPQGIQEAYYEATTRRLRQYGERSVIWRTTSADASRAILPGTLDFVYLDARHDYASVMEDLHSWFDRVKPGGILAGHDYLNGELPEGRFGVRRAVDEFFSARGLSVHQTIEDNPWPSWVVSVPAPNRRTTLSHRSLSPKAEYAKRRPSRRLT